MNRLVGVVVAAAFVTGCSASPNPGGQVQPTDVQKGTTVQVTADALQVATTIEDQAASTGAYPPVVPFVQLTGNNKVTGYVGTPGGFRFCVVEPATGAWAFYDSAEGRITGSGTSHQTCSNQ